MACYPLEMTPYLSVVLFRISDFVTLRVGERFDDT